MSDGKGLELSLAVHRLRRLHGVEIGFEHLNLIPMVEPTDGPMILEGYAATCTLDLQRMKFRKYAFGWPLDVRKMPPLLHKHREDAVAGEILALGYDDAGNLTIRARVTHEQARRCNAFSVAATILDYELRDVNDRDRFHAVINAAKIDECSTTDCPANPHALVTGRYPVSPKVEFYDLMIRRVAILQQSLTILQQMQQGVRT